MKVNLYTLLLFFLLPTMAVSQRYFEEVFDEVTVTQDVKYGTNISIVQIILGLSSEPGPEDLYMDVYEPAGDDLAERPVVIFAHRGDFLPPVINQTPYGSKRDSAVVEMCKDMARRGFVAVSMGYRLGWNPFANDQEIKAGVLQASYRLSQDMHNVVRFLRMNAAEQGNTFRIDASKIAMGGFDSAGWGAASLIYLKNVSQVANLVKFVDLSTMPPTPFIIEEIHGNPQGTNEAFLNIPNHVGYSSAVSAVINIEGGLGDLSWIEAGDPPIISIQRRTSFNGKGIRDVSLTAGGSIIIPTGAFADTIMYRSQELGNQDVLINAGFDDALSVNALAATGGLEGLLLYDGYKVNSTILCDPTPGADSSAYGNNSYPWNWYDAENFGAIWDGIPNQTIPSQIYICAFDADQGNPNDAAISRTFIDTMTTYIAPRLVVAMNLSTGTVDNALKPTLAFKAFPNPASGVLNFKANKPIRRVQIVDLSGRVLFQSDGIGLLQQEIGLKGLTPGLYIAKVQFDEGTISEKILIH
ncbi:MAG: T9SS type A sorting domain-containing protein [Saprospiraceae bacterium]